MHLLRRSGARLLVANLPKPRRIPPLSIGFREFAKKAKEATSSTHKTESSTHDSAPRLDLMIAAADGNLDRVRSILSDPATDANCSDYEKRTPLHLAAAEGKLQICELLVEKKASVNAVDRVGYTPLEGALESGHDDVIRFLRSKSAIVNPDRKDNLVKMMLLAASKGDLRQLQRLTEAGANLNDSDYDMRTPLHLAASEGQVQCVEYLVQNGANINAMDRFGNTPLQDAHRGIGRGFKAVIQVLQESGATINTQKEFGGASLAASIQQSMPLLVERSGFSYIEAWLPTRGGAEFVQQDWYMDKEVAERIEAFQSDSTGRLASAEGTSWGKCWETKKWVLVNNLKEADFGSRYSAAVDARINAVVLIPMLHEGNVHGIFACYSLDAVNAPADLSPEFLNTFSTFTSRLLAAGNFGSTRVPEFEQINGVPKGQQEEIFKRLVTIGVFNANTVYHEVDWFYNMGLQQYYFQRFSSTILANHIHAYMAAKKLAATTGDPENIWLHIENNKQFLGGGGPEQALVMIPAEHSKIVAAEKILESRIQKIPDTKAFTLEFFQSARPTVRGGKKKLGLYVLQTNEYANPSKTSADDTNIWNVASEIFLKDKSAMIRNRYQELISASVGTLSPIARVYERYRDGTTPIMFAFARVGSGSAASYMLQLTEVLKQLNLSPTRKFIETFSNKLIVFSLYLNNCEPSTLAELLQAFSLLHIVPKSAITPHFLEGGLKADEYTYMSACSRFVYYFINQRSEDFDALSHALSSDPINLGRLRLLHTSLKREAVSQSRIVDVLTNYPGIMAELTKDFKKRVTTPWTKDGKPAGNEELVRRIKNEALSPLDFQVLMAMYAFNVSVLKTNFFKKRKASLSFRLNCDFIEGGGWPEQPYAVFFVMGSDFQGFHVRFRDVARGGIRIITSRDRPHYLRNLATMFAENYGLAYTQNKKNKDIPEFGSKGTILLNQDAQGNKFLSFQKYISGLLDLMVADEDVVDNYNQPELLFLGPDEGTADMMAWAAKYAESRGYAYWRSFTTGKPPVLGGIPHDTYGMTTRSVHRYVKGCLDKLGLDESQVTKVQTGGPDGDLGSNEILISNDKTTAIVDGSGVLYDPQGLDRTELTRLAKARRMIGDFDKNKLSSGGFKVLINDVNITLPNGDKVESGLNFRNEFHLHPLSSADLFVPCGGRPESVNLSNVKQLLHKDGKPRFKIIVEGANLFFTNDARMLLENAGVILYKDASTNKGGVTSSSLEVLAALALDENDFDKHMSVRDINNPPKFYRDYVNEIQQRIEADAGLEFECIWREHERSKMQRFTLTDLVSDKINSLTDFIRMSDLWTNENLRRRVLIKAIPKTLQELVGLDAIHKRVPEPYIKAIFCSYLASRYVYKYGIHANEFAFFEFMQPFIDSPDS